MRVRTAAIILAAALTGCATTDYPAPAELTNVQLCEAFFYAGEPYAAAAGEEATRRGVRCAEQRDAVAQYRQEREAARWGATQGFLQSRPVPALTCRTVTIGTTAQTVCQ